MATRQNDHAAHRPGACLAAWRWRRACCVTRAADAVIDAASVPPVSRGCGGAKGGKGQKGGKGFKGGKRTGWAARMCRVVVSQ